MGHTSYSSESRSFRHVSTGWDKAPAHTLFKETSINDAMSPCGVSLRESRDSVEHPNSVPIVLALDVTGSMGTVPHYLVKTGLPEIMDGIINKGIKDPQILFMGIGDHECDRSPLQIGQFESGDELLDKWLTTVYLEGGGGGNDGESYHLAWLFAGKYTEHDAMDKRKQKGYLFTIGDEPVLKNISKHQIKAIMGPGQYSDETSHSLLEKAMEKYNVYHLHIRSTRSGSRSEVIDAWRQLLGGNLVVINDRDEVKDAIIKIVTKDPKISVRPIKKNKPSELVIPQML